MTGTFILISMAASSQDAKPKDRLANLNLTVQQKTSVDSVRKIYDGKRAEIKKDETLSKEDQAKKMAELRKEQADIINSILTEEQRQELKKQNKKKKDNG